MRTVARVRDEQYQLRMPSGLRARIKSHAKANCRSMNTEIVLALEMAFPEPVSDQLLIAAQSAERFIRGFEDDEMQEGITDLLAQLRSAITAAGGDAT